MVAAERRGSHTRNCPDFGWCRPAVRGRLTNYPAPQAVLRHPALLFGLPRPRPEGNMAQDLIADQDTGINVAIMRGGEVNAAGERPPEDDLFELQPRLCKSVHRLCRGKGSARVAVCRVGWRMTISVGSHQFPPAIIRHDVWLHVRFTLSYRRRPRPTSHWRLDEVAVMPAGRQFWLWRAVSNRALGASA